MYKILEKIERFVDRIIPYLIILLLGILVIDIFYQETAEHYHTQIYAADVVIITFFFIDLAFKYNRVRDIPLFLRRYWLDILAVFPFFLFLRLFEEALLISERSALTLRNLLHAGLIVEEDLAAAQRAARASEVLAKEGRVVLFLEKIAPLRRMPRLFKAISFFEHPNKKKTLLHKKN
ncbi:MAG TPA: hypothetical protein VKE88_02805 [Candidatus Nanoarchaeia archaeon]|nr:hypothetical protein [Candidatus Nanoarchaeia archaeon]